MRRRSIAALSFLVASVSITSLTVTSAAGGTPRDSQQTALDPANAYPEPPPGFVPLQATSAQLVEYGFPNTDLSNLPSGVEYAYAHATNPVTGVLATNTTGDTSLPANVSPVGQPNALSDETAGEQNSCNWSGKQLTIDYFNNIYSDWTVHNADADGASSEELIWPGLGTGADSDHDLLQAGTREQVSGGGSLWNFWYEVYPEIGLQPVATPTLTAGNEVFVEVWRDGSTANFYIENESTGDYHTYTHSFSGDTGSTAEWIVERPGRDGTYEDMPFFDTQSLTDNYAFDEPEGHYVSPGGLSSHNSFTMYNIDHDILVHTNGLTGDYDQNFMVTRTTVAAGGGTSTSNCGP